MPYDPTFPTPNTLADADAMRAQLNALNDRIDAVPAGPPGPQGDPGPPFATAVIDSVATLTSGENATVSVSFDGTNVRLSFGIPRGADGAPSDVSSMVLAAAIAVALEDAAANSSGNSNAVATLDTPFADPDSEALRQKINELLLALRR